MKHLKSTLRPFGFFSVLAVLTLTTSLNSSFANDIPTLSEGEVEGVLLDQGLSRESVSKIVDLLKERTEGRLMVTGYLFTQGWNGAFFVDRDKWAWDATIAGPNGSRFSIPSLFTSNFYNGGIAVEFGYKWMFMFMTAPMTVNNLDGATCGRGFGMTIELVLGVDAGWLPCKGSTRGDLFIVSPKIGFGGGLRFPKITLEKNISADTRALAAPVEEVVEEVDTSTSAD